MSFQNVCWSRKVVLLEHPIATVRVCTLVCNARRAWVPGGSIEASLLGVEMNQFKRAGTKNVFGPKITVENVLGVKRPASIKATHRPHLGKLKKQKMWKHYVHNYMSNVTDAKEQEMLQYVTNAPEGPL